MQVLIAYGHFGQLFPFVQWREIQEQGLNFPEIVFLDEEHFECPVDILSMPSPLKRMLEI